MKHIAVLDVGGTLIADPIVSTLERLGSDGSFRNLLAGEGISFDVFGSSLKGVGKSEFGAG